MKNTILLIYVYLVCFVTLTCGAIYTGVFLYKAIYIAAPGFMLSEDTKEVYLNNKNYIERYTYTCDEEQINRYEKLSGDEVTKMRLEERQQSVDKLRNKSIKDIIKVIIILIIDIVIFFVHWKIARRVSERN